MRARTLVRSLLSVVLGFWVITAGMRMLNVPAMMYFDEPEQKRLLEKFARCLNLQGYLFVGHAESLLALTDKFTMVHRNSGTAYQKVEVIG